MIKLIACDMDGTLLNEEGKISNEFFDVFHKITEKNIKFAVASGRQYYQLVNNFRHIKDEVIYIAENGTIVKYNGEEIHSCPIERKYIPEVIRDAKAIEGVYLVLCGKKCAYIDTNEKKILSEVEKYYLRHEIVDNFSEVDDDILKIAVMDFKGAADNSNPVLYPKWKDRLKVSVSGEIWLDIYNKDANKGIALEILQKRFGIRKEETMAFGDYFNDIEMLMAAKYSYAMENAPEGVKKHANFVAKSNRDNGVVEVIEEKILKAV